ncbi:hypothetical protein [Lysobacter sp. Root690]|uniref:hypothetical protein n=1 Tax=Lysobacter sp. Root690 TaxID=1736588 RepID=UPI000AAC65F4|nr:hypothetical protein [Lysobacter sp. Root690]
MLATAAAIRCIVAAPLAAARAEPVPRGAYKAAPERAEASFRAGSPAGGEADGAGEPH